MLESLNYTVEKRWQDENVSAAGILFHTGVLHGFSFHLKMEAAAYYLFLVWCVNQINLTNTQ
jgi:hypothetical protein